MESGVETMIRYFFETLLDDDSRAVFSADQAEGKYKTLLFIRECEPSRT